MKTIRSLMVLAGLSVAFLVLAAAGANAQGLTRTEFAGKLTLPVETQWGTMTLPAGDYNLYSGRLSLGGAYMVEIDSRAHGSLHGWILGRPTGPASSANNSLICVREANSLVVRKLELPALGESVNFAMPHGMKLLARRQKHGKYTLAEAPMLIERVPVALNGK